MKKNKGVRRDHVREACKRLGLVLRTSKKLGVKEADLGSLPAVMKLCAGSKRGTWLLTIIGLLVFFVFVVAVCTDFPASLSCHGNSSSATGMIHTVRKIPVDVADTSNDNEDPWMTSQFQLRRDR